MERAHDVVIVGGGHNALVAAAYLATAGLRVVVLERLDHFGGAAVSQRPWPGVDARLSRYAYLVSLLPQQVVRDLGLRIRLAPRRYASYTPDPDQPGRGLLIDTADRRATAAGFGRVLGDATEAERFESLGRRLRRLAALVFPTLTEPLPAAGDLRRRLGDDALWQGVVERPLGELVREALRTDLARGLVLTDGLIGTFAAADDPGLAQNRCFLYHVIGGGTGDWLVPVGGMGAVSAELETAARAAGADLRAGTEVASVTPDGEVGLVDGTRLHGRLVLSGVGPQVLAGLLRAGGGRPEPQPEPEGAQLKVNLLVRRLPRLRDPGVAPEAAFSGTFHVHETMSQLDRAYHAAAAGSLPTPLPLELYCHTLTDPSILGPRLRAAGAHTLTLFGLQVPHRMLDPADPDGERSRLEAAALASLDSVLAEPIADVLHHAPDGTPCLEARTTHDLATELGMTGGAIFHGPLAWPWADPGSDPGGPAARWGVATGQPGILYCGAAARRGGAVSGVGGHNAARAALELLR